MLRVHPAPRWRVALWAGGLLLVLVSFVSPLQQLARNYLLLAHLLQNVVLAEWAPLLLVAAIPPSAAAALSRSAVFRALVHPIPALGLWLVNYIAWHLPWAYDAALRRPESLLHVEHLLYLATGLLFWWPVLHDVPRKLRSAPRAFYVLAAFICASPIGLMLALLPSPVYEFYEDAPRRVWGLSPLTDQQIAGVTMAVEQAVVLFAFFIVFIGRFLREEEAAGVTARRL
jgi:cytochrome c oxidase assembly factor CtaG